MSKGRDQVRAQRARLVEQAGRERDQLARLVQPLRTPLAVVDRGIDIARGIKRSAPILGAGVGIAMAALAFLRPSGIGDWLSRGQAAWQVIAARRKDGARPAQGEAQPEDGSK